ncbi:MAG: hypothetical protein RMK19_01240 [Bacteroidia bacterium]|nr:hypothetical protein [Bacteroidia bacterium]MDW8014619.1 hypothetical protein [Bacteroidia bacterium]
MRFLGAFAFVFAQPLPDVITFSSSSDTFRAFCRTFGGGWTAEIYRSSLGRWILFRKDTFFINASRQLVSHIYLVEEGGSFLPVRRLRLEYAEEGRQLILNIEEYDRGVGGFRPYRRVRLWGGPVQWDSLLRGWTAILGLDWSHYNASLLSPHPVLAQEKDWGDSMAVEDFLPEQQVFLTTGGYWRRPGTLCDTLFIYEWQGTERALRGNRLLCRDEEGRLFFTEDTVCHEIECSVERRFFIYDDEGLLVKDSMVLQLYSSEGVPLGEVLFLRRYSWDEERRLIWASYPGGVYELSYSGQVVSLPLAQSQGKSPFSERSESVKASLYDLSGRKIWEGWLNPSEGLLPLEKEGLYLLYEGHRQRKIYFLRR